MRMNLLIQNPTSHQRLCFNWTRRVIFLSMSSSQPPIPASLELTIESQLGAGAFGSVWHCRNKQGEAVAIKWMYLDSPMHEQSAEREAKALRTCSDCPLIVRLIDDVADGLNRFFVLELLESSLLDVLSETSSYSEATAKSIIKQLADATHYLHAKNIAHLDIKLDNVMFRRKGSFDICLIDFGFAVVVEGPIRLLVGTPEYQSPECVAHEEKDPRIADMWALGIVSFALLTGELLFQHRNRFVLR